MFDSSAGDLYRVLTQELVFTIRGCISQSSGFSPVDDGQFKHSLHVWLIETRKHFPGICWLQIGGSNESKHTGNRERESVQVSFNWIKMSQHILYHRFYQQLLLVFDYDVAALF